MAQVCECADNKYIRWRWAHDIPEDPGNPGHVAIPKGGMEAAYSEVLASDRVFGPLGTHSLEPDFPDFTFFADPGSTYYVVMYAALGPGDPPTLYSNGNAVMQVEINGNFFAGMLVESASTGMAIQTHSYMRPLSGINYGEMNTIHFSLFLQTVPSSRLYAGTSIQILRIRQPA